VRKDLAPVVDRLQTFYTSPTNRLYCLFLRHSLKPFIICNMKLQEEAPQIHILQKSLNKLLRDLLVRFVSAFAMSGKLAIEVDFKLKVNQKKDADLIIGEDARQFLSQKEVHLRDAKIIEFYTNVRQFFIAGCNYMKSKLPLQTDLLKKAQVADVGIRTKASYSDLMFFI